MKPPVYRILEIQIASRPVAFLAGGGIPERQEVSGMSRGSQRRQLDGLAFDFETNLAGAVIRTDLTVGGSDLDGSRLLRKEVEIEVKSFIPGAPARRK